MLIFVIGLCTDFSPKFSLSGYKKVAYVVLWLFLFDVNFITLFAEVSDFIFYIGTIK